jgi:hypothetical protein
VPVQCESIPQGDEHVAIASALLLYRYVAKEDGDGSGGSDGGGLFGGGGGGTMISGGGGGGGGGLLTFAQRMAIKTFWRPYIAVLPRQALVGGCDY